MTGFWRFRNVLVTGCSGFLGGWLVQELLAQGACVVGLVRDWVPKSRIQTEGLLDGLVVIRGAVEDQAVVERAMNEYEIDTVFHLAAQTIVTIANRNPISTFESNIRGTWTMLEAARRCPTIKGMIVASSDKAYGMQETLPYKESSSLSGRFPYDASKACADLMAQSYAATWGLPVVITRCGNFFGGGDLNFSRIVPGTVRSVLQGERPIIRSDGRFVRDYLYVRDGARACLLLAERSREQKITGEAFNFSYESPQTAWELVDRILRLMDRKDLSPLILNEAENEIPHQYLCSQKAREMLGWRPCFTLEEGLEETITWYRRFFADWSMG